MEQKHIPLEMNQEQVRNLLMYIDASQSEAVKDSIFSRLGCECFHAGKLGKWVDRYVGNVQALLDWVNVEHASKYWERLEITADGSALTLTGKKVHGCACAFADCSQPPLSLCLTCCRSFQQEFFGKLLGRKVAVTITEAYLLGGERCSTIIHLV